MKITNFARLGEPKRRRREEKERKRERVCEEGIGWKHVDRGVADGAASLLRLLSGHSSPRQHQSCLPHFLFFCYFTPIKKSIFRSMFERMTGNGNGNKMNMRIVILDDLLNREMDGSSDGSSARVRAFSIDFIRRLLDVAVHWKKKFWLSNGRKCNFFYGAENF